MPEKIEKLKNWVINYALFSNFTVMLLLIGTFATGGASLFSVAIGVIGWGMFNYIVLSALFETIEKLKE